MLLKHKNKVFYPFMFHPFSPNSGKTDNGASVGNGWKAFLSISLLFHYYYLSQMRTLFYPFPFHPPHPNALPGSYLHADKTYLLGLCSAFKCQPLEDIMSLTSNMSKMSDPNATIVMSGLPITNNSGISFILQNKQRWFPVVCYLNAKNCQLRNDTLSVFSLILPWSPWC